MKKSTLLLCSLIAPCAWLFAESPPPSPAPAAPTAEHEKESELEGKMDAMKGAFRKLRKQIADPAQNASSLELTGKLLAASEASVALIPQRAADIPEADRPKFIEEYQTQMKRLVAEVKKLEAALKAGKNEEGAKILAELDSMQKQGHKEFRRSKRE